MPTSCHVVKRQVFEIEVRQRSHALECQERVRMFCDKKLQALLEDTFSEMSDDDEVLHVDRLEIDLGFVSSMKLEQQLDEEISKKLIEVLKKEVHMLRQGCSPSSRSWRVSPNESTLFVLQMFLETGSLPWWASPSVKQDIGEVFLKLLEENPEKVVGVLMENKGPTVSARLAKQFSLPLQQKLLRGLISSQVGASKIEEMESGLRWWIAALTTHNQGSTPHQTFIENLPTSQNRWTVEDPRAFVHETAFSYLTHMNSRQGSLQEFSSFLVEQLTLLNRLDRQVLLDHLVLFSRWLGLEHLVMKEWLTTQFQREPSKGPGNRHDINDSNLQEKGRETAGLDPLKEGSKPTVTSPLGAKGQQKDLQKPSFALDSTHPEREKLIGRSEGASDEVASSQPNGMRAQEPGARLWDERAFSVKDSLSPQEHEQFIANAGLVIVWPLLSNYFAAVGLIDKNGFRSEAAKERAVFLLQHLVTGKTQWPEHELVLNKLLCGWNLEEPVSRAVELTESEQQESLELLQAVIDHWTVIKNTSLSGFRQSFLQREGRLQEQEHGWHLMIPRSGYDVLLDQLPWGVGFVRLPWMSTALTVEW